ncbi:hypothetical protein [Gordonia sp. SMJS1]|uniref:hypothetical protein n=1 Tax=Gordonia sp. SMJS1 TaxID=3039400 RepID=UPI0024588813|nr:hypothetical protein [Gordonia sp. SMJS1]WGJ88203.1 hypothetical protein QAD21_24775 [Gordonia sp. SMJS1]
MSSANPHRAARTWEPIWLVIAVVVLVVGIIVVAGLAFADQWDANRVNAFAAWAAGLLTLTGVALSLYEAHKARREAADVAAKQQEESEAHQVEQARQRWELERQRRIDLEIRNRVSGMRYCVDILDSINLAITDFAEKVKTAAFAFDDAALRSSLSLDVQLTWVHTHPLIGARALPVARSSFAFELQDHTIPQLEELFAKASTIADAATTDELLAILAEVEAVDGDTLRLRALEDFTLDMDAIAEAVDRHYPPFAPPTPQ